MIDQDGVDEVLASLLTCEVVTIARDGTPAAWPMVPLWLPDERRVVLTTSIGFPAKAAHLRRDPRIALLFSDPTGSGLTSPPVVLLQGRATVSTQPQTVTPDLAAHWARVHATQPVSRYFSASAPGRWFMDWYYMRLVVDVAPRRVLWWPDRDTSVPPRERVLVDDERDDPAPAAPGGDAPDAGLARRLGGFAEAVLCGRDAEGRPLALRGPIPAVDSGKDGAVRWPDAPGTGLAPGPASLLCHRHDDALWNLRSFQARGTLDRDGDGWSFRARRVVDGTGMSGPLGDLAAFVAARGRAGRYLRQRGLPRPRIPWSELRRPR